MRYLAFGLFLLPQGDVQDPVPTRSEDLTYRVVYEVKNLVFDPFEIEKKLDVGPAVDAARSTLVAMKALDYDAWHASWDAAGRKVFAGEDRGFKQAWKRTFRGAQAYIVAACETRHFTLIAFELRRDAKVEVGSSGLNPRFDDDGVYRSRLLFVREGDAWVQTGRYFSHPVMQMWRTGFHPVRSATDEEWAQADAWPPVVEEQTVSGKGKKQE